MGFREKYLKCCVSQFPESPSGRDHSSRSQSRQAADNIQRVSIWLDTSVSCPDSYSRLGHTSRVRGDSPLEESRELAQAEQAKSPQSERASRSLSSRMKGTFRTIKGKFSREKKQSGRQDEVGCIRSQNIRELPNVEPSRSRFSGPQLALSNPLNSTLASKEYTACFKELSEAFNTTDADGLRKPSATELWSILHSVGEELSEEEFHLLSQTVDTDGCGEVELIIDPNTPRQEEFLCRAPVGRAIQRLRSIRRRISTDDTCSGMTPIGLNEVSQ